MKNKKKNVKNYNQAHNTRYYAGVRDPVVYSIILSKSKELSTI